MVYWTGFKTNAFPLCLVAIGFVLYAMYYHGVMRKAASQLVWKHISPAGWTRFAKARKGKRQKQTSSPFEDGKS